MGYLLADHGSARPCSAVMLGPQPIPVNCFGGYALQEARPLPPCARFTIGCDWTFVPRTGCLESRNVKGPGANALQAGAID